MYRQNRNKLTDIKTKTWLLRKQTWLLRREIQGEGRIKGEINRYKLPYT